MRKINASRLVIATVVVVCLLTGCSKDHLDPSQIGRFRPIPAVNLILDSLGVAEESASAYEGAEEPKPSDVVPYERDYTFGAGDTIRIQIFELLQENYAYVDNFIVNESGNISIPEIGQIQAAGMTESQLEDEIRNALSPGILKNPSVTVLLEQSENRVFSILGDGISNPNRYLIPRNDFRLLDALAVAGSAQQFNVSYVYVTRKIAPQEQLGNIPASDQQANTQSINENESFQQDINDQQMLEVIEPSVMPGQLVVSHAEMATEEELEKLAAPEEIAQDDKANQLPVSNEMPRTEQGGSDIEWTFKDGRWVPVNNGKEEAVQPLAQSQQKPLEQTTAPMPPTGEQALPDKYAMGDLSAVTFQNRVIKIPKDKLFGGDPRYNIIIRPGDTITVQLDVVGEYYILGNVNNQGIVNLTGRPMTLKMAIAAAGGLGPLAWPKKCEVIRRVGEKKEEIVMVDLEKIANGTQPDFFIKPNDVINVGTHGVSRYLAVLRNAFRATYGFGFIYDRNFGDRHMGLDAPLSPFFGY
ncbi:MAG: polysaccharide biosynthesis/export family protein [Planctomycetaceae bacterium]|nr:polysaccharide biosynthesis/export family protein [Planctomycetaceae bacterium]